MKHNNTMTRFYGIMSFVLCLLLVEGRRGTLYAQGPNTWAQKTDFEGSARYRAVGFSIGSKGYIGTGSDGPYALTKDFWEYDPTANTWTQKADFGGSARERAVGFSIGSKGYIGTGSEEGDSRTNDFWEYDPTANTWTQKADFGGSARNAAVGFSIGSKGYIGTGDDDSFTITKDFWEYDPTANTWTQKADFGGSTRYHAVGFSMDSKGYIGTGYDANGRTKDFWEYNPTANSWTQKADFGGSARYSAVGFSMGSKGYIGTGLDADGTTKDFWEYNPTANSWTQKADFGGSARGEAVGFSIGSNGYIGTGAEGYYSTLKDFWAYTAALSTTLTLGTATNPTTCGGTGSIAFTSTGYTAGNQTLSYTRNGETPALTQTVTVANDGSFTLSNLTDGVYSNFAIGATTATGSRTLTLPASCYFITRWDLSKSTGSGGTQISFGVGTTGTVNYTWAEVGGGGATGSGTFNAPTAIITGLPSGGTIDLSISPTNFNRFLMNNGADRARLMEIKQWGTTAWASMGSAFSGCSNMTLTATDVPNTAAVTSMRSMFSGCSSFNQPLPVTFNTAAVTDMSFMFSNCSAYNQPLPANLNTAAVITMNSLFSGCSAYNHPLPANLNTEKVTNMNQMFNSCSAYNQPLPANFNTSAVTSMVRMFQNCIAYNEPLPATFNTEKVIDMTQMFNNCSAYNQALPASFNTANVTNMSGMFNGCTAYNQALPASFNTEKAIDMSYLFQGCTVFNQPLPAGFKCKVATDVSYLFANASAFNQNLVGTFIFPDGNINMEGLFDNCGLDVIHYTAVKADIYGNILNRSGSWGGTVGAAGMKFCGLYINTVQSAYATAIGEVEWGGYFLEFQGDEQISCEATGIVQIVGTNPTTCSGTDGKIAFVTTTLTGAQTLSYKKDGNATTAPINITNTNVSIGPSTVVRGVFELTGLGAGVHSDFAIGSTTPTGSQTLGDPTTTVVGHSESITK